MTAGKTRNWETTFAWSHQLMLRRASLPVAPTALLARDRFFSLLFLLLLRFFLLHYRRTHHYYHPHRPHRHHDEVQRSCGASHRLRVSSSVSTVLCVTKSKAALPSTWIGPRLTGFSRFTGVESDCTARADNFPLSVTIANRVKSRDFSRDGSRVRSANYSSLWERDLNRKRWRPCPSFASRETECDQRRIRIIPIARVTLVSLTLKMVRGLSQWTKTLSFPARVSPQRPAKESKGFHVSPSASPTSPPSPINDTMDKAPIITDEVWHISFYLIFFLFRFTVSSWLCINYFVKLLLMEQQASLISNYPKFLTYFYTRLYNRKIRIKKTYMKYVWTCNHTCNIYFYFIRGQILFFFVTIVFVMTIM